MLTGLLGAASPVFSGINSTNDDSGPLATLLTDEERERKAKASERGTYFVILNPASFQNSAEYSTIHVESAISEMPVQRRGSSLCRDTMVEAAVALRDDPNTVILTRFESSSRCAASPTGTIRSGDFGNCEVDDLELGLDHSADLVGVEWCNRLGMGSTSTLYDSSFKPMSWYDI